MDACQSHRGIDLCICSSGSTANSTLAYSKNSPRICCCCAAGDGLWNKYREKPIFIGVLLLFCFPIGLFLVWKHSTWTNKTKWIWTGAWAVLMVIGMANRGKEKKGDAGGGERGISATEGLQEESPLTGQIKHDEPSRPKELGITSDGYAAILPGMTESEVEAILGCEGKEMSSAAVGHISSKCVAYKKLFSSKIITIIYSSGRVQAKAKAGF